MAFVCDTTPEVLLITELANYKNSVKPEKKKNDLSSYRLACGYNGQLHRVIPPVWIFYDI